MPDDTGSQDGPHRCNRFHDLDSTPWQTCQSIQAALRGENNSLRKVLDGSAQGQAIIPLPKGNKIPDPSESSVDHPYRHSFWDIWSVTANHIIMVVRARWAPGAFGSSVFIWR